jgi:transposase
VNRPGFAGYDGFWLQRRLAAEGIACWVMDPGSLQVDRRARRAKTDRLDAAMLLRALVAWCRGDRAACRMVQVPSLEREDARRTHRERQRLIAERVQHVNRVKGLLATQGVYEFRPLRRDRWARLAELRTGDGRALPPRLRREIEREFGRLELVLEQIQGSRPSATQPPRSRRRRTPTRRRWRASPSSAASARSWRPRWCAKGCTGPSPTAAKWPPTPG